MNPICRNNLMSTTDYMAREVLGMPGSLVNYIYSGNPFKGPVEVKKDSFTSSKNKVSKKGILKKILNVASAGVLVGSGIYLLSKGKKFKSSKVLSGLRSGIAELGSKIKDKLSQIKIKPKSK